MPPDDGKRIQKIKILIVDDIPEARENLKKLLVFEPDIEVVGTASTGREGVEQAKALQPNIVLMDINMPDMDGIAATKEIRRLVPGAGVIMMSVQGEAEYLRRAMAAGARDFLTKPPPAEELYATVRSVYEDIKNLPMQSMSEFDDLRGGLARGGTKGLSSGRETHVITVYSPQGGAGKTTIATNLATELMREGTKVLLIDAKMQFGDVSIFLNLKSPNTILDLIAEVDNLDMDHVDSVLCTHDTGLRVLLPPARPEEAELVEPAKYKLLIEKLRGIFDFIVIDLPSRLDEIVLESFDLAERILLVATPTLPCVIHTLTVLNLMDEQLGYAEDKTQLVINKYTGELEKQKVTLAVAAIEQKFRRKALGVIPMDERRVLFAVNRGTAVAAKDRVLSPAKELIGIAESLRNTLMPEETLLDDQINTGKTSGLFGKLRSAGRK